MQARLPAVALLVLCFLLGGCASYYKWATVDLFRDAAKDPWLIPLVPLALPGAVILDVMAAPVGGGGRLFESGGDSSPALNMPSYPTIPTKSSVGSAPSPLIGGSSNSSYCAELRRMAEQCRTNLQNIGGGSTGQAGAFRDCYNNYAGAYNAQCR
jgi:hypothetical protein